MLCSSECGPQASHGQMFKLQNLRCLHPTHWIRICILAGFSDHTCAHWSLKALVCWTSLILLPWQSWPLPLLATPWFCFPEMHFPPSHVRRTGWDCQLESFLSWQGEWTFNMSSANKILSPERLTFNPKMIKGAYSKNCTKTRPYSLDLTLLGCLGFFPFRVLASPLTLQASSCTFLL